MVRARAPRHGKVRSNMGLTEASSNWNQQTHLDVRHGIAKNTAGEVGQLLSGCGIRIDQLSAEAIAFIRFAVWRATAWNASSDEFHKIDASLALLSVWNCRQILVATPFADVETWRDAIAYVMGEREDWHLMAWTKKIDLKPAEEFLFGNGHRLLIADYKTLRAIDHMRWHVDALVCTHSNVLRVWMSRWTRDVWSLAKRADRILFLDGFDLSAPNYDLAPRLKILRTPGSPGGREKFEELFGKGTVADSPALLQTIESVVFR